MAIRRRKRGTTPVAAIDPKRTRAVVKDPENAASLLFEGGLALWGVYRWLSWRVQAPETVAVECLDPLPDIGDGPFNFLCDIPWEKVPVFQDVDRFLPDRLVFGFSPLPDN